MTLFTAPPLITESVGGPAAWRTGAISVDSPQLRHAPLSSLRARLAGLLSGPRGIAVIEQNGQQQSFSPGDRLADGSELIRIFHDRIIISRVGQYEALILK